MSLLTACQEAAVELSEKQPTSLFSGTVSPFASELLLHANRTATAIAKAYDWQSLTTLGTVTGDGTTINHSFPTDFDRMPKKARLHSENHFSSFHPARDLDQWLFLNDSAIGGSPGSWIVLNGMMQVYPALGLNKTARFYYQSKNIIVGTDGLKAKFTADDDVFRLDERLLALGIVWRWRASKGVDYQVSFENFKLAEAEEVGHDRGPRVLTVGRQRIPAELAYDGTLGAPFGGSSYPDGGWDFSANNEPTFDEE